MDGAVMRGLPVLLLAVPAVAGALLAGAALYSLLHESLSAGFAALVGAL